MINMDESWRMRMGNIPHSNINLTWLRSTEDRHCTSSSSPIIYPMRHTTSDTVVDKTQLDPEDFDDVFGGPPQTVLLRKFSTDHFIDFYHEVFRPPDFGILALSSGGRSLPAFRIPSRNAELYAAAADTYEVESGGGWRSQLMSAKSKSINSSSEEMNLFRSLDGDDVGYSSFASKLRPLNVPHRWKSAATVSDKQTRKHAMPMPFFPPSPPSFMDNQFVQSDFTHNFDTTSYCGCARHVSSPETISLEPNSYRSTADDLEYFKSPSAPASTHTYQEPDEANVSMHHHSTMQEEEELEMDEVMSSYVIEITSDYRDGTAGEEVSIDEAIAWAKGKYSNSDRQLEKEHSDESEERCDEFFYQQGDGCGMIHSTMEEDRKNWITEEDKAKTEMDMQDEDIQLWLAGKENDIRLLLSTLDHVLWPNSGWYTIPLTSLTESTQVKKAYQKARLCLHPDKLTKGATLSHQYVAEKVFFILQDAWTRFMNQCAF